jgi:hypothetical protein
MSATTLATGQPAWCDQWPGERAIAAIRAGTIASIVIKPLAPLFIGWLSALPLLMILVNVNPRS